MPSYCAVPSCKLNKYKGGKNPSTFQVPNDESLRERWIMSIPGIEFLRLNQRVCEKHFEEHLLIKEYVKYDNSGKLIAQVPLAHARLKKGAVPTIFDQTFESRSSHKILTTDHTYALLPCSSVSLSKADAETVCVNTFSNLDINSNDLCMSADTLTTNKLQANDLSNNIENTTKCEFDLEDASTEIKPEFVPTNSEYLFVSATSDIKSNVALRPKDALPNKHAETKYQCAANDILRSKLLTANDKAQEDAWTNVTFDSVSFNLKSLGEDSIENNLRMKLPKPWNANKLIKASEETLLLSCIVQIDEYGIQKHVLEKAVTIKASREMIYEIYSTPVDITPAKLPKFLKMISTLPEILKKFKDLRTCEGIMTVDLDYVQNQGDFKRDIYSNLRHKDCSVLSIHSKRCIACKKASKILSQKVKRIKDKQNMQRISNSANPLEQMKLKALKKKLKFRAAETYRSKKRFQVLTNFVLNQKIKVANVSRDVLEKISKNQKSIVQEIVSSAQKCDPRGCRYTNKFILLCMLMNIRSQSYYEFLRKNNIIPLPCTKTIKDYLTLIGSKQKSATNEKFVKKLL
nr:PREDICTED: uncharacterized protein LOC100877676 isoform X1 [Megachile rotundata]